MNKVVFFGLDEKISIPLIVESQTFEPEFKVYSDDVEFENDVRVVFVHQSSFVKNQIKNIRKKFNFKNRRLVVVLDKKSNTDEIIAAGANSIIEIQDLDEKIVNLLKHYLNEFETEKNFNEQTLHPFKMAVEEIYNMMALMNIEIDEIYTSKSTFHYSELTSSMALSGKQKGNIAVTLNKSLAKSMVARILAANPDELSLADICDGIGEIVNMIAGGAKARISSEEELFDLSAPIVIIGDYLIHVQQDIPNVNMVFKIDGNYFVVRIGMLALAK